MEVASADQLGIGGLPFRTGDDAIHDAHRRTHFLRGALAKHAARFRRCPTQKTRAVRHARAAGRSTLIARGSRVAHHYLDLVGAEVHLFRDDLRHGDIEALPHVHLAEEGLHGAVRQHGYPRIKLAGHQRGLAGRLRERFDRGCEGDDQPAGGFQKFASVHGAP